MRVRFYRDRTKQWRWVVIARNGRKVASCGEGYRRYGACRRIARKLFPALVPAVILLALAQACAPPPPNLSPQARQAWQGTRVIRALDVVRDLAVDAHAQQPPLLDEATTRQIVIAHKTAVTVVHEQPAGWQAMVLASLDGVESLLPSRQRDLVLPYVEIARAILRRGP